MSYHLLALLLLPLIGSALLFFLPKNFSKWAAFLIALLQLVLTFYLLIDFDAKPTVDSVLQHEINWPWSDRIKSSIHFGLDGLSMLMVMLTNILVPLIIFSSFNESKTYPSSFYALILMMQFGLLGVFTSLDGLLFYIFWEITLIPIWFIVGLWGEPERRLHITTKFFVFTFVGSLFMLAGLIYVYTNAASFALTDLYNASLTVGEQNVVFWFIFLAFAVKLPIFPFHTWQADTYSSAPTQGSMLLSGIMLKMAVYGLFRYLLPIVPAAISGTSGGIVLLLAVFTVLYGALIAIVQNDAKRLIAYSSLSHIGLITAGIFAAAMLCLKISQPGNLQYFSEGAEGAMVMAFAHGFNVVGLFLCADVLLKRFGTRNINEMGGAAAVMPKFAVLFMIVLFGSLGVPLTNGFIGEFLLIKSVFDFNTVLGILAGFTIILAAVYLLRFYAKTMFGKGNEQKLSTINDLSDSEFAVLASIAGFALMFGIYPQPIIDLVGSSLEFIFHSMAS